MYHVIIASTIKGVYVADEEKCAGYSLCITVYLMRATKLMKAGEYIKLGIIKEYHAEQASL